MAKIPFYGRQKELERLNDLLAKKTSSLVVIKGRRRIGKSRLIREFSKGHKFYSFTGLPPSKDITPQKQRDAFVEQMKKQFSIKKIDGQNWYDIFWHLAKKTARGRVIIALDEINWMGTEDPVFLGTLKNAWDLHFSHNPQLIMILSGSMATWIDENILSSTGFMGRISLELTLKELPLYVCNEFWRGKKVSAFEKFQILGVTGGVPRYLEEINPNLSAKENILKLAFTEGGLFVTEFERIFSDLFAHRSDKYKQIVERLIEGSADLEEIAKALGIEKSGALSEYVNDLEETGYIAKDTTWNLKTKTKSNLSEFRLKDNYLRFYLKYIEPRLDEIKRDSITDVPAWSSIMGLQFENLVVNNFRTLFSLLCINPAEVLFEGPYFQRMVKNHPGCQIDYLIQNKFNTLYVCEIKFSLKEITSEVIEEVQKKIDRMRLPRNFSVRPVLIHVNGISEAIVEKDYFAHIVDFSQFLES